MEKEFLQCFYFSPPNFEKAEELLSKGLDINMTVNFFEETLLSEAITECETDEETGRHYLLEIIRFFLDHGYDLTTNNGRHGAEALRALCWSTCDGAILDAAKLLLEAGADPLVRNGDGNTVLDTIRWKISGCVPVHDDREREALFTALYKLVESTVC